MERDQIRAVFFDVFGTLILYPKMEYSAVQFSQQAARLGLSITSADFAKALVALKEHVATELSRNAKLATMEEEGRVAYWEWWYAELLRLVGVNQNVEKYASGMWVEYIFDPGFTLDSETPILLQALRPHFTLGIISNAPVRLWEILEREGLASVMDVVVISSEVGVEKPDKEIFAIALKHADVTPTAAVYVGDSLYSDVVGAENAGMIPVLLDRKCRYPDVTRQRIKSLLELQGLLNC